MKAPSPNPVESTKNLRERIERLLKPVNKRRIGKSRFQLEFEGVSDPISVGDVPTDNVRAFVSFVADCVPEGDVYLFGGVLRDIALFGRRGFDSDIDLVVEGEWDNVVKYLESLSAIKNKFGGYRFTLDGWPIDIWNAEETWAIREGLVPYRGIASLTETTVLNWDGILMNWRTRNIIHRQNYFHEMHERILDIVLKENPSPRGMAVRVFRHLCLKDASKITPRAADYLTGCTRRYSFDELKTAELNSYGTSFISEPLYRFFEKVGLSWRNEIHHNWILAGKILRAELDLEMSSDSR